MIGYEAYVLAPMVAISMTETIISIILVLLCFGGWFSYGYFLTKPDTNGAL